MSKVGMGFVAILAALLLMRPQGAQASEIQKYEAVTETYSEEEIDETTAIIITIIVVVIIIGIIGAASESEVKNI